MVIKVYGCNGRATVELDHNGRLGEGESGCMRTNFVFGSKGLKKVSLFLQQAVRLKEKGIASEIVAVSCGPAKSEVKLYRL